MRVRTYHRHVVNRGCPFLGALLMVNWFYFFFFAAPAMLVNLGMRWKNVLKGSQWTWCALTVGMWIVLELFRLRFGNTGNRLQRVPSLLVFTGLTLFLEITFVVVYFGLLPQRNSLDFSLTVVLATFIAFELILSIRLLYTIMSNNRIDYLVYGARTSM